MPSQFVMNFISVPENQPVDSMIYRGLYVDDSTSLYEIDVMGSQYFVFRRLTVLEIHIMMIRHDPVQSRPLPAAFISI